MEVTALRRTRSHPAMVDVCTSDGDRCRVHERRVLELGLTVGTRIEDDTRALLDRHAHVDAAEQRMLRLIARRARSQAELLERLQTLGLDSSAAQETVERLQRVGLVDDQALAVSVAERTRDRGHGHLRVKHDLQRLQVDPGSSAEALAERPDQERERAYAVVVKRFGAIPTDPGDLARASAFLCRRGYDADTVATVLRLDLD